MSLFPKSGQYQIYVTNMQPDGVGALAVAFEQLKRRLHEEGLFDPNHKKPLPRYPERVALVTSPTGAAVRDMIRILGHRWPMAEVIVCPVRVQGEGAAEEIADMLDYVDKHQLADVIITGRGGGSMEDLWAFNDERVARAIYESELPVISAVGHEPDVTIADYVADARASTPSNAAEIAVPDQEELRRWLLGAEERLVQSELQRLERLRQKLDTLAGKRVMTDQLAYVQDKRMELVHVQQRLGDLAGVFLGQKKQQFAALAASLDAMSPLKVLGRGYAMVQNENGQILKSYRDVESGERVNVTLGEGGFSCTVEEPLKEERR